MTDILRTYCHKSSKIKFSLDDFLHMDMLLNIKSGRCVYINPLKKYYIFNRILYY